MDDVLLSSAEDTRTGFMGFLFKSLEDQGFRTKVVVDHRELKKEEIEGIRIFIFVLSDGYADCQVRLCKLAEIVNEFGSRLDRRIFPVFYDVDVSDVRYQQNSYKNLEKWAKALTEVADFHGWPFKRSGNISECKCIEEITQKVSEHVACSVGLDRRVEKVNALLYSGSYDGVQRVVICGVPGIGKTTVARGVYHSNGGTRFDHYCFLDKVGECLSEHGLAYFIRLLLSKIIGDNDFQFGNADDGFSILEQKVKHSKIFLVLEDIFNQEQLQDIVKLTNLFSSNSKVIITAEENCFLLCQEIEIYEVEKFNQTEALELLSLKACNSRKLKWDLVDILVEAETLASGVPFTLEMIGSYFGGKSRDERCSIIKRYKEIQNEKKERILQISFDALQEEQKKMLTYIAFCRNPQKLAIIRLFGVSSEKDIKALRDKSLIKVDKDGLVTLHDLTLKMVRDNATQANMELDKQEMLPASGVGSVACSLMELEESTVRLIRMGYE